LSVAAARTIHWHLGPVVGRDISQGNNLVNTADYTVLKGNWLKSTDSADITGMGW